MKNKKLNLLLTFIFTCAMITGCAQSSKNYRDISSVDMRQELLSDEHLESGFYQLFDSTHALALFQRAFQDHKDLYFYNQALIYAYDEALEKEIDPIETPLYLDIWEGRDMKEHSDEALSFYLIKLDEIANKGERGESEKARAILDHLFVQMRSLKPHQKIAFVDVIENYKLYEVKEETRKSRHKSLARTDITRPFEVFDQEGFSWEEYYQSYSQDLEEETKARFGHRDFESLYSVEYKANHMRRIRPSTGREGNLIGGNFPQGTWSLTYDDGPKPQTTRAIIEMLSEAEIPATFFWLARNAARYPSMIELAHEHGMELANHSYSHANLPREGTRSQVREIQESTEKLERLYDQEVKFFRLPYGSGVHNTQIRKLIAEQGLIHVFWNVDSLDWQDRNPRSIFQRVISQMENRGRGIILFHDIHNQSVQTTELLIDYIKENQESLTFKNLEQIVEELNNIKPGEGPRRTLANLNVRTGPSTSFGACAVLPQGAEVEVLDEVDGFYEVKVKSPSEQLRGSLRECEGKQFVSASYISH